MGQEGGETQKQYLGRLAAAREKLVEGIKRPPVGYEVGMESASTRPIVLAEFAEVANELRAIEATRLFRLRAQLIGLRNRVRPGPRANRAPEPVPAKTTSRLAEDYARWVVEVDQILPMDEALIESSIQAMPFKPLIGIALAIEASDVSLAQITLSTLSTQLYDRYWVNLAVVGHIGESDLRALRHAIGEKGELILDPESANIADGLNACVRKQPAEWLLPMNFPQRLGKHALFVFADAVARSAEAEMIYSDEDEADVWDERPEPNFKPDWNEPLLLGMNYLGSSVLLRRSRLLNAGGFKAGFGNDLMWDALLRYTEGLDSSTVVHLPFVLLHTRSREAKSDLGSVGTSAVQSALERRKIAARVSVEDKSGAVKLRLEPATSPLVSLIIPTRNHAKLLKACVQSIDSVTDYPNFEYVIVDNGTDDSSALKYLAQLASRKDVRVIPEPGPFNYAALNNLGAFHANGEVLAFINNDLEAFDADWMSHLVAHALNPKTGVVGARLLYPDKTVQHAGVVVGLSHSRLEHVLQRLDPTVAGYQRRIFFDQSMSAVMGACMFVRKSVFEELGGLDAETFPIVCNDVDLCLKARLAGYENVYAGSVACVHHESKSRGRDSTQEKVQLAERASATLAIRWGVAYTDPYFNPNLALWPGTFGLSFFPRVHRPWYR